MFLSNEDWDSIVAAQSVLKHTDLCESGGCTGCSGRCSGDLCDSSADSSSDRCWQCRQPSHMV